MNRAKQSGKVTYKASAATHFARGRGGTGFVTRSVTRRAFIVHINGNRFGCTVHSLHKRDAQCELSVVSPLWSKLLTATLRIHKR